MPGNPFAEALRAAGVRRHSVARGIAVLLAVLLAVAMPARADEPPPLRVFAAASLTNVLPSVADAWTKQTGREVTFSFDATSRVAAQLQAGAPADLFFSADARWMDDLAAKGLVRADTRVDLLGNRLVVVVPASAPTGPASPADLAGMSGKLALAGESVPAGRYGRDALRSTGAWDAVRPRVVEGDNVRTVLAWVARGEASAGIVYATDARIEPRVRVAFAFPDDSHAPIVYPAAVTTDAASPDAAAAFLAYCSAGGRPLFEQAGFTVLAGAPPLPTGRAEPAPPVNPRTREAVWLSLQVGTWAALMGMPLAIGLGWLLARGRFRGRTLLGAVVLTPMVLPPVVTGLILLDLVGRNTRLGGVLARMGLPLSFSFAAAVLAALVVGLPLYVWSCRAAFAAVDPRLEEVSLTLRQTPWRTFVRVTLPLALPGLAAGAVLAFARGLGEFGATAVLAGNIEGQTRTIALDVYHLLEAPGGEAASRWLVVCSLALSCVALAAWEVLNRWQRQRLEVDGG